MTRTGYNKKKAAEAHIVAVQGGYSIIWKGGAGTRSSGLIYSKSYAELMAKDCGASEVILVATPVT